MHFDDASNMIQTTCPGVLGNNPITVEAWIKPNAASGESIITAWGSDAVNGGRFTFRVKQLTNSDVIRIEIKGGGLDGTINVADGNWHHVAVVYNPSLGSNRYKLYVDGNLDNEGDISQALNIQADVNLRMGRRISTTYTGWFGGSMDEVRLWNVARSAAQLQNNMNGEFCTSQTGLMAYYKFNEGTAGGANTTETLAHDEVNGYHGTLMSFALTGTTSNWITGSGITPNQGTTETNSYSGCQGYSVTVGTNTYTSSGTYTDVFTNINGCDSVIVTNLSIVPAAINSLSYTICSGDSVQVNGNWYTQAGQFADTLLNAATTGCDSILQIAVTVAMPVTNEFAQTLCSGESIVINGNSYSSTGTYTEFIPGGSAQGCDSTIVLHLNVLSAIVDSVTYSECYGFSIDIDGTVYDTSGHYEIVLPNSSVNGCDSTIVLDLVIEDSLSTTITVLDGVFTSDQTTGTYQWIDCSNNQPITNANQQSFEPTSNGSYAVILSSGSCSDTSECRSIDNVGLENLVFGYIRVFPNPTSDVLHYELETGNQGYLSLTDMSGRIIWKREGKLSSGTIDLKEFQTGNYVLSIETQMGREQVYISKQ